ncbi:hypothetical protein AA309_28295 [Microvirga vignae]|uniref:Uncharacterized protein n=1 Tax=Microvirga vignae TaxID=1225564 RepID=A0A0H1R440_9HYPH|nr:hypothetical protein AA309_28295 [Microvirga vignae]
MMLIRLSGLLYAIEDPKAITNLRTTIVSRPPDVISPLLDARWAWIASFDMLRYFGATRPRRSGKGRLDIIVDVYTDATDCSLNYREEIGETCLHI